MDRQAVLALEARQVNHERVMKVQVVQKIQETQATTKVVEAALRTLLITVLLTQVGLQYGAEVAVAAQMQVLVVMARVAAPVLMGAQEAQAGIALLRLQALLPEVAVEPAFLPISLVAQAQQAVLLLPYLMEHKNELCCR
jgi:hypothetical protein